MKTKLFVKINEDKFIYFAGPEAPEPNNIEQAEKPEEKIQNDPEQKAKIDNEVNQWQDFKVTEGESSTYETGKGEEIKVDDVDAKEKADLGKALNALESGTALKINLNAKASDTEISTETQDGGYFKSERSWQETMDVSKINEENYERKTFEQEFVAASYEGITEQELKVDALKQYVQFLENNVDSQINTNNAEHSETKDSQKSFQAENTVKSEYKSSGSVVLDNTQFTIRTDENGEKFVTVKSDVLIKKNAQ